MMFMSRAYSWWFPTNLQQREKGVCLFPFKQT